MALKFPSAVRMLSSAIDIREQARALEEATILPTEIAQISGVESTRDLLVLLEDQVQVFMGAV